VAMERQRVRALIVAMLVVACTPEPSAPSAPSRPSAPIRTDRDSYVMRNATLTITHTFTAPREAHITNCNGAQPMGLQRNVEGQWVNAFVAAINGCASAPVVLQPGQQRTAQLFMAPGAGAVVHPMATGAYRVVWFGVVGSDGNELPIDERVSAPITIAVQ
jgi:hypothetical protein